MTKEYFYRVENPEGTGPYQGAGALDETSVIGRMYDAHCDTPLEHPTPAWSEYFMTRNEICAFRSMRDLFRWFGGYLPGLLREGDFRIVRVPGTATFSDGHQVVIRRDHAITQDN